MSSSPTLRVAVDIGGFHRFRPGGRREVRSGGERRSAGIPELMKLAQTEALDRAPAHAIVEQTRHAVSRWREFAAAAGVPDGLLSGAGAAPSGGGATGSDIGRAVRL
mgnify:CR=1 FL=1